MTNTNITLPCLSLRQPWAWMVTRGGKSVENRRWNTRFRGTFLLQAAKGLRLSEYNDAIEWAAAATGARLSAMPSFDMIERGGIVGAARLVDVHAPESSHGGPWHMTDQFGFQLESITPLPFRPYTGSLGFFRVTLTDAETEALRTAGLVP